MLSEARQVELVEAKPPQRAKHGEYLYSQMLSEARQVELVEAKPPLYLLKTL
jgi:hypothetical protein